MLGVLSHRTVEGVTSIPLEQGEEASICCLMSPVVRYYTMDVSSPALLGGSCLSHASWSDKTQGGT